MLARLDADKDELVRLQFRCAALERRVEGEQRLRDAVASLEAQATHLASQLQAARSEMERLVSALTTVADLNRHSFEHISALHINAAGHA